LVLGERSWGSYLEIASSNIQFNSDSNCSHEDLNNNLLVKLMPNTVNAV